MSSVGAALFAIVTIALIVMSAAVLIFPYHERRRCGRTASESFVDIFELVACAFFTLELFARLAVAKSTLSFLCDWYMIFDILAVVPCWMNITLGYILDIHVACGTFAALLRALRMFRLLKLGRKYEGGIVIMRALKLSTPALSVAFFFLMVSVIVFSTFLFFAEKLDIKKDQDPAFYSIPHAIWFMTVTMTTVGYGEVTPLTVAGRCVTSVAMLFGVLFLSMPLAIVGNNFCMVWDDKERVIFVEKLKHQLAMKNLDVVDMMQTFEIMDTDHSGMLSFREFREALRILQIQMSPQQLAVLWRTLDTNHSGDVSLRDFVELIHEDEPEVLESFWSSTRKLTAKNTTSSSTATTEASLRKVMNSSGSSPKGERPPPSLAQAPGGLVPPPSSPPPLSSSSTSPPPPSGALPQPNGGGVSATTGLGGVHHLPALDDSPERRRSRHRSPTTQRRYYGAARKPTSYGPGSRRSSYDDIRRSRGSRDDYPRRSNDEYPRRLSRGSRSSYGDMPSRGSIDDDLYPPVYRRSSHREDPPPGPGDPGDPRETLRTMLDAVAGVRESQAQLRHAQRSLQVVLDTLVERRPPGPARPGDLPPGQRDPPHHGVDESTSGDLVEAKLTGTSVVLADLPSPHEVFDGQPPDGGCPAPAVPEGPRRPALS